MRKKEKKMLWKPPFIFFLPVIEMLVIGYITGNFFSLNNILNIIYRFSMLGLVVIGMSFYQNLPVIDLYIIFPKLIMKLKKWRCAYEREI